MTAVRGDARAAAAAGHGHLRAGHADREQVIEMLKVAFVQGRLSKDELGERAGRALAARTYADLAVLTADIPAWLAAARPARKPTRAQPRPPMNNVAKSGACSSIAAAVLVATMFIGPPAFFLVLVFYLIAMPVVVAQTLSSRQQHRSRGQLPPRPAQHGRAVEGKRDGGLGDELARSEACGGAGARPVRGHGIIQRTWRPPPCRPGRRRPASLRATG